MSKRKYSDVEKAEALARLKSNNNNIFRTSHELNIPWATLASWAKGTQGVNSSITEMCEDKTEELANICERVARKYLKQAENEWCIASTPGQYAMTTAAIAIDKTRLLRGESTQITETVDAQDRGLLRGIELAASRDGLSLEQVAIAFFDAWNSDPDSVELAQRLKSVDSGRFAGVIAAHLAGNSPEPTEVTGEM